MEAFRKIINEENVIKDDIYNSLRNSIKCIICLEIIIEPMTCMSCHHAFCNSCIHKWLKENDKCPIRCQNTKYQKSSEISELLSKIKFVCPKCNKIIMYDNMMKHYLSKCELGNDDLERSLTETKFTKIDDKASLSEEPETKLTSKKIYFLIFNYFFYIVITLGFSGVGKTSLIEK
jgi:hypothetical protein